ncbi:hypothetical protein [Streptomyces sp. NPDC092903]|uniref:hypothetical protein n=1 Tax=Streptomyces sp. NPDC092903 TaxID=3366017 RepID=UPI003805F933
MDVQVLDYDLAAAVTEFSGQEFGESACPFPDYGAVRGIRDDPDMLVMSDGARVVARRPTKPKISAAIANLQRGDVVIVERVVKEESGDWYVQVLMREDNTFQLEYRDGAPAEHYQTRTVSREKVVTAMLGWVKGETEWKVALMWNNIASSFEDSDDS